MAIDYKQLRAGNLVLNHKGEVHVITPWDIWNLECYFTKNMVADKRLEDWRYIPLDEEWMKRFGFHLDEVWVDYMISLPNNKYLGYEKEEKTLHLGYHKGSDFRDINLGEIAFVHQLQNIVYPLMGVELEVKL